MKEKEELEKTHEQKLRSNPSAFDLTMNTRHLQDSSNASDPRDIGSSPCLKRGPDQLGSPGSPQPFMEMKKNRNKGEPLHKGP